MDRRRFLGLTAAAGGSALAAPALAGGGAHDGEDDYAILVDLTACGGCRMCEFACAGANGLPDPDLDADITVHRDTSDRSWVVVNAYDTSAGEVYVRRQCMHCVEPACAAACLTKAMLKTEEGPVIWRADKCMGCRYCMISCPFDVPKFEYDEPVPKIQKCRMCWERVHEGGIPACVENCPGEALTFGRRSELLRLARERIAASPDQYVQHIYGEHEAGGTGWLYISPVPFEELGFRTGLETEAYPELTRDFLTSVPLVLVLWPAMLLALRQATGGEAGEHVPAAREEA